MGSSAPSVAVVGWAGPLRHHTRLPMNVQMRCHHGLPSVSLGGRTTVTHRSRCVRRAT